jgi:hypothetical protein
MIKSFLHRSLSLGLAAVLTLCMLGSIDELSQPDAGAQLMAQQAASAPRT